MKILLKRQKQAATIGEPTIGVSVSGLLTPRFQRRSVPANRPWDRVPPAQSCETSELAATADWWSQIRSWRLVNSLVSGV
ncbi:MAG UNVERIFIED_CONTAM: hypothetical protein LVR18_08665 [Planctomycetaceae bacterium]